MSTNKGFNGWGTPEAPGDEKLLKFLYDHKHNTPFEMAGAVIEVKAPILVFREWHRHRTQSFNEMSARYTPLPDENYMPSMDRLMVAASKTNKQAGTVKGSQELNCRTAELYLGRLRKAYEDDQDLYDWALKAGVPKELARVHLPVGRYSRMRTCANLRNWLAFLTLREDPAAQYEIRVYAHALSRLIAEHFPRTHALYAGGQ
jgi:thymidylate synthase (FAD)